MSRETSRRAKIRSEATLGEDRSVQLQSSKRFFSSQGSDRASREAKALTNAFGAGVDLANTLTEKGIEDGRREAVTGRGAGEQRAEDNKNQGYNTAWDQMDAEADLNLAKKELPEVLRGASAEDLSEAEVQGLITDYMQGMFEGVTPDSAYGSIMAPGLLALEQGLLDTHRDQQIEKIQMDQRSTMMDNVQNRFEASADRRADNSVIPGTEKFDYEYLGAQTNTFFDGTDKRTVYWESIYDFAIRNGRPDIIRNVPKRFASGDPTGIDDPNIQDEHRAAEAAALRMQEKKATDEQTAAASRRAALRADGQLDLLIGIMDGIDPTATALEFAQNGIIKPEDVTASISAFRTMRDDRAQHGFDPNQIAILQTQSALDSSHPSLEPNSLLQAFANGIFGPPDSPEAKTAFRQMLQDVQGAKDRRSRVNADPRKKTWVNRFDESFPTPKDQFGVPVPGVLTQLRAEYSAEFEMAILAAPPEKYREIYAEYSKLYVEQEKLQSAQATSRTPVTTLKQIVRGNFTPEQGAAHARQQGWTSQTVINMRAEGEFGDDFVAGSKEAIAYREFLLALANPQ